MDSYNPELIWNAIMKVFIIFILYVIWMFVKCLAFMRAFKLCGHKHPWAAFIPFYNKIVLSECTGQLEANVFARVPIEVFKYWVIPHFVMDFLTIIPFIGIINFVYTVACKMFCYKWVYIRLNRSAAVWAGAAAFFSCFIGIIPVVIFFTAKNDNVWHDSIPGGGYDNTYGNTYEQGSGDSTITFN